ncbi:hypothetical protein MKD41_04760 [Lutibacter sp. A64]|uniref:hypothetical protein n=1 Tax=Lutibacter sp. A64 TaxID=2918526 RepID=UPI001F054ECD|nr:hypothetical protein [Lutibacter sp. A64]UMB54784.1 hypothetical protein MKD41_04760 [Lutibacter sp. A64]
MKKLIYILLILLIATNTVVGQKKNRQNIKLLKTAFITDAIALKPVEAEKFWPIYNLYTNKIQELKFNLENSKTQEFKNSGGINNMSETNAQEVLNQYLLYEKEVYEAKINMIKELSTIISAHQIVKLQKAERDFNKRMLQEYGRRKRMGQ